MLLNEINPEVPRRENGPYGWDNQQLTVPTIFLRVAVKGTWTLRNDDTIDVNGSVIIPPGYPAEEIPVKFNSVSKHFSCHAAGTPHQTSGLNSLVGTPKTVGGYFNCDHTQIMSLHGGPEYVGEDYLCSKTKITTLAGGPKYVGGNFNCTHNEIHTLEHAPEYIGHGLYCAYNPLLTSLKGIHKVIKHLKVFDMHRCSLKSNILGLALIPNIKSVVLISATAGYRNDDNADQKLQEMINKAIKTGDVHALQQDLIDAGLANYARL